MLLLHQVQYQQDIDLKDDVIVLHFQHVRVMVIIMIQHLILEIQIEVEIQIVGI